MIGNIKSVIINIDNSFDLKREIELLKKNNIKVCFYKETGSYLKSICKLGTAPSNCLAVDSSKEGLLEAKNFGMQTLCVYPNSSLIDCSLYSISSIKTFEYFFKKYVIN
ncbi:MAG: hypothetical protein PHD05_10075 [Sphaerochaetaceae bacterium]|nr:hypothetical protein [Sphaerochaetaceae bacterium]